MKDNFEDRFNAAQRELDNYFVLSRRLSIIGFVITLSIIVSSFVLCVWVLTLILKFFSIV